MNNFESIDLGFFREAEFYDADDFAMLYQGLFPTEFYCILHGRVHYEFRLRRALKKFSLRGVIMMPWKLLGWLRSALRLKKFISAKSLKMNASHG